MTGADMRRRREDLGLTQEELARLLDVHAQTVSKWERQKGKLEKILVRAMRDVERELK